MVDRNGTPLERFPRLLSQLVSYFVSRKNQDENLEVYKPGKITPGRLKLAFRRANGVDQERLVA